MSAERNPAGVIELLRDRHASRKANQMGLVPRLASSNGVYNQRAAAVTA